MIPHNRPTLGAAEELAAQTVLRSGWVAQGPEVESFENELCASLGLPEGRAVAVSSGTAALFLALEVLGARGQDVAFPVYACSALRNAVAMAGAKENLLDVAPGSPNADPAKADAPFAILPHMFGIPCDLKKAKGTVIEDCAQSIGGRLSGAISIFSFYATKLITSGGQGGMLVSKNAALIEAARDYRQFDGRKDRKTRFNLQMTDLQAAIGRAQLKRLPEFLERREEIFRRYQKAGLDLLDAKGAVRYRAVLKTDKPAKVLAALHAAGIKAIVPVEDWELLGDPKSYPNAAKLSRTTVSLPCYPSLSDGDVDCVIAALRHA
jgi:perosamine synthetase